MKNTEKTMDKLVALCKGRGFIYPGSEIYGGLANTWDFGPLGVELKNNIKSAWRKKFIQECKYNVGLDSAILMNPQTWVASGHIGGFSDPLMDCKACKTRHRADNLIEDFDGMFCRMLHLMRLMMLGIMGMFVAPFGMLVSKWGALVAFAQTGNVLMIMVLAFGSAATFFFWGKWLAKLSGVAPTAQTVEVNVHKTEWVALNTIAALLILCCVAFPVISSGLVSPYLAMVFGRVPYVIGKDAMYLMVVIVAVSAVVLLTSFRVSNKPHGNVYLSGVGTDKYRHFRGSMGHEVKAEKRNWYSEDALGEKRIGPAGSVVCCSIILF